MFKSDNINELASALAKAQALMESAKKDTKAYSYNYSDLASVITAAKPSLNANGLSFSQLIEESEAGLVKVTTMLLHSSGQFLGSTGTLEIPDMKSVNKSQAAGAAQSYLKRYQLQALIGLPSEDNDLSTDARPIPQLLAKGNASEATARVTNTSIAVSGNNNVVLGDGTNPAQISGAPPKLTDTEAKATTKAPSFSRNKTTAKSSNDLGI
jgi:hypothetical protein